MSPTAVKGAQAHRSTRWLRLIPFAALLGALIVSLAAGVISATNSDAAVRAIVPAGCTSVYTIHSGDTLSRIARRYHRPVGYLKRLNQLSNANLIFPGERLCVGTAPALQAHAAARGITLPPPRVLLFGMSGDYCRGYNRATAFARPVTSKYQIPPGCFSLIFYPGRTINGYSALGWGWCNWWPATLHRVLSPSMAGSYHLTPRVGAIIYWNPLQNHSTVGHFGLVEAISPDGRWMLTSQMNYYWRGGGFGRVIFAYEPTTNVSFIY